MGKTFHRRKNEWDDDNSYRQDKVSKKEIREKRKAKQERQQHLGEEPDDDEIGSNRR